jgi:hypothetical protein
MKAIFYQCNPPSFRKGGKGILFINYHRIKILLKVEVRNERGILTAAERNSPSCRAKMFDR